MAEGYTAGEFDTYVLVQNPNTKPVQTTFDFITDSGEVITKTVEIPAQSRYTIKIDDVEGLANCSVSTKVYPTTNSQTTNQPLPIIVERASYFNYEGLRGGHSSISIGTQ